MNAYMAYMTYVLLKFEKYCIVVFDGYDKNENNAKSHEHRLRVSKATSYEIHFGLAAKVVTTNDSFLGNNINKSRFISILKLFFVSHEIQVKQAEANADALTVATATDEGIKGENQVILFGNDRDLMVMLACDLL